jgi:hypothetical protein
MLSDILLIVGPFLLITSILYPIAWVKKLPSAEKKIISFFIFYKVFQDGLMPSFSFVNELIFIGNGDINPLLLNLFFISFVSSVYSILIVYAIKIGSKKRFEGYDFWKKRKVFNEWHFLTIALLILLLYVFLTNGQALLDPRYAYQNMRTGIGFIWSGFIVFGSMWMAIRMINGSNLLTTIIVYGFFAYVSGSKGLIIGLILPLLSYPRLKRSQKVIIFTTLIPISFLLALYLFNQFSASEDFITRVTRYFNQFHHSYMFYADYLDNSIDLFFGKIYASSFWGYIPRILYEDKPYSYGSTYLVEYYWQGMAETGHTPSFGMYTTEFADFGFFGAVTAILTSIKLYTLFAVYVISTGGYLKVKSYAVAYAVLIIQGVYFHLPIVIAVPLMYFLLFRLSDSGYYYKIKAKKIERAA